MYSEYLGKANMIPSLSGNIRSEEHEIEYYDSFYSKHGQFPDFTHVLIETQTDCNRSCSFCPQSEYIRPFKQIDWDVYTNIIDQLSNNHFSGRIALFMVNEPLLDDRIIERIEYARKVVPGSFIDINTNGHGLNIEVMDKLFVAGLDNINIDDYRPDRDKYPKKLTPNVKEVVEAFRFNPKLDIGYRRTDEVMSNHAGNVKKKHVKDLPLKVFCNWPFRKIAISPYGDVILCCSDYKYQIKCGNVSDQSIFDLWHSEKLNKYRLSLLLKNRIGLCRKCDINDYGHRKEKTGYFKKLISLKNKIIRNL